MEAEPDLQGSVGGERKAYKPLPAKIIPLAAIPPALSNFSSTPALSIVSFDRRELGQILNVYGRKVASGEWRDYAMDFGQKRAVFAIFRRASEQPLYRIEKNPALANKQGAYSVVVASGLVLRRGADLARVLSVLDKPVKLVQG